MTLTHGVKTASNATAVYSVTSPVTQTITFLDLQVSSYSLNSQQTTLGSTIDIFLQAMLVHHAEVSFTINFNDVQAAGIMSAARPGYYGTFVITLPTTQDNSHGAQLTLANCIFTGSGGTNAYAQFGAYNASFRCISLDGVTSPVTWSSY